MVVVVGWKYNSLADQLTENRRQAEQDFEDRNDRNVDTDCK